MLIFICFICVKTWVWHCACELLQRSCFTCCSMRVAQLQRPGFTFGNVLACPLLPPCFCFFLQRACLSSRSVPLWFGIVRASSCRVPVSLATAFVLPSCSVLVLCSAMCSHAICSCLFLQRACLISRSVPCFCIWHCACELLQHACFSCCSIRVSILQRLCLQCPCAVCRVVMFSVPVQFAVSELFVQCAGAICSLPVLSVMRVRGGCAFDVWRVPVQSKICPCSLQGACADCGVLVGTVPVQCAHCDCAMRLCNLQCACAIRNVPVGL